ncbi:hypothetical protein [Mesorhizobium sp. INR15]|uniref:hypothetical protein n=1 Tax=Mesorhizobium sp. INR15 TaxID=2654248 RepID=UPI00189650F3|nr:hypothetical protein [Mesorhizobium sp. INR15]QPC91551.1 hypothetical protein GA829_13550 [Mesorhizobium sp. INR15]
MDRIFAMAQACQRHTANVREDKQQHAVRWQACAASTHDTPKQTSVVISQPVGTVKPIAAISAKRLG